MYTILILILLILILFRTPPISEGFGLTPDNLFTHLKYISTLLSKYQIKHWLIYGTLLGAIRDSDIIPYDYDFDLGAQVDDVHNILALNKVIKKDGYTFEKPYSYIGSNKLWRVSLKVKYKGTIVGDIYLYKKFRDGFMRRFDVKNGVYFWPKSTFPAWYIDNLTTTTIRGTVFPIPRQPHKLLRHWYGKTWLKPIKAPAQGGKKRKGYDHYGGANNMPLKNIIKGVPDTLIPVVDVQTGFVFPPSQEIWIKQNETVL